MRDQQRHRAVGIAVDRSLGDGFVLILNIALRVDLPNRQLAVAIVQPGLLLAIGDQPFGATTADQLPMKAPMHALPFRIAFETV